MSAQRTSAAPRVGLIGCGAIARLFHGPALKRHADLIGNAMLVDPDHTRAQALAADLGATHTATDVSQALGAVDAAIVCVPHHLHVPVCRQLLQAGVHVLCEKPLAEDPRDVEALAAQAADSGVVLAVNNMRRAYPAMREVARIIHEGDFGAVRRIHIRWGERFDWDAASGFYFGAHARNRGALLDRGAHVLDLVCWWLRGEPTVLAYHDDSDGGSEAVADLTFRHGAAEGRVELSWLSKYENTIDIDLDRARITCGIYDWTRFTVAETGKRSRVVQLPAPAATPREISNIMIDNFIGVAQGTAAPLVPGAEVLDSIALIARAYASRQPLAQPWHDAYRRVLNV